MGPHPVRYRVLFTKAIYDSLSLSKIWLMLLSLACGNLNTHIMRYENAAGKILLDDFIRKQKKTSQGTSAT